jgi:hypothetical protein
MKRYKDWSPTGYDTKGLGNEEYAEWFVAPVIQTRDSGQLEQSNYAVALKLLNRVPVRAEHYQELTFNHWACGWFSIILVSPETAAYDVAVGLEASLENYPILNEEAV